MEVEVNMEESKVKKSWQPGGSDHVTLDVAYERTASKNKLHEQGYTLQNCGDRIKPNILKMQNNWTQTSNTTSTYSYEEKNHHTLI